MTDPTRLLFVDQGRGALDSAMGHVRVRHALEAGLAEVPPPLHVSFAEVPRPNARQRAFYRRVPGAGPWHFGAVRWHVARGWAARALLREQLRSGRPDVAHVTTDQVAFLLAGVQRRLPCVLSLDILAIDWACMKRGLPADGTGVPAYLAPIEAMERRALEQAPLNIAWTTTVAGRVRQLAPRASLEVLHPGLDLSAFAPPSQHERRMKRVLFVGGRWKAKGGPQLVEALGPELGRTVSLDVVTTEDVPARTGITVHRAKPGDPLVPELLSRADVFCLPTRVDACPWVVLEAMASGVPVVSTHVGSIAELLGDGSSTAAGRCVTPGDAAALRHALVAILDEAGQARALGEYGRARVHEHYDARVNTPVLVEMLREIAAAPRPSHGPVGIARLRRRATSSTTEDGCTSRSH